jgi:hypothetical protein
MKINTQLTLINYAIEWFIAICLELAIDLRLDTNYLLINWGWRSTFPITEFGFCAKQHVCQNEHAIIWLVSNPLPALNKWFSKRDRDMQNKTYSLKSRSGFSASSNRLLKMENVIILMPLLQETMRRHLMPMLNCDVLIKLLTYSLCLKNINTNKVLTALFQLFSLALKNSQISADKPLKKKKIKFLVQFAIMNHDSL